MIGAARGAVLGAAARLPSWLGATLASWQDATNVVTSPGYVRKSGGVNAAWDAGARSVETLASGDGSITATHIPASTGTSHQVLFGFGTTNPDASFESVRHALFLGHTDGNVYVFESGVDLGAMTTYAPGDEFTIAIAGGVVTYKKNGSTFYTSGVAPAYPCFVDVSIHRLDAGLSSVTLDGAWSEAEVATTLLADTFTAANGESLASHAPDEDSVGGGWAAHATFAIQDGKAEAVTTGYDRFALIDVEVGPVTLEVEYQSSAQWGGVLFGSEAFVNGSTRPSNCWWVEAVPGGDYVLYEQVSGARTERARAAGASASAEAWRIEATTSGITLQVDGVEVLTYAAACTFAGTHVGFQAGEPGTYAWDDLVVTGAAAEPPALVVVGGGGSTSGSLATNPRTLDGTDGIIVDGTAADVQAALDAASNGQKFRLRGGLYAPTSPFTCPADNVTIDRYGDERVVLDGGNLSGTQDGVNGLSLIHAEGRQNQHWRGFILQGAGPNRGVIHLLNSDAIKVDQMILRAILGEGVQVYGSDDCVLQDLVTVFTALDNGARVGSNAPDCYSITANGGSYSYRTRVTRCFGAYGQDDVLDNFRGVDTVIEDSAAWKGGYHIDGSATVGDGGNFKTGGDPDSSSIVRGSVAVGARFSNFFHNTVSPSAANQHVYEYLTAYDAGYVGIDAGSQPNSDIRNSIAHLAGRVTSGPLFYLGGSGTPATCFAGDPSYEDLANLDLSLANGSPCLGAASDGDNQGASVEALRLLFKWANTDVMSL